MPPVPTMTTRFLFWLSLITLMISAPITEAQESRQINLVVLGDSLSAGFLIPASTAFPSVLQTALRQRGYPVIVTNAGVSGDTAEDGLARLERDVPEGTDGVVLELGANNKLKGRSPAEAQDALDEIVRRLKVRRIPVLVAGIRFTDAAGSGYNGVFSAVSRRYGTAYYPDIYAKLASDPKFTIFDNTHPSPLGVVVMVKGILPTAERFVSQIAAARR